MSARVDKTPGMRLATIRTPTGTRAVRVDGDAAVETGHADVGGLLRDPDWRSVAGAADGDRHDPDALEFATLVTTPEKIICVGLNYLDHIAETGRERPTRPTLFPKFATTLIGAHDPIELPHDDESTSVDWEAELGLVIGTPVRRATDEQAAEAIAGYTVVNDITVRDFQRHTTQFMPGKAWERTTPVGPYLRDRRRSRGTALPDLVRGRRRGHAVVEHRRVVLRADRADPLHLHVHHIDARRPDLDRHPGRCRSRPGTAGIPPPRPDRRHPRRRHRRVPQPLRLTIGGRRGGDGRAVQEDVTHGA